MPTRPELLQKLGDSKDIALKRFIILEHKLNRDSKLKREYTEFIHEYLSLRHMRASIKRSIDSGTQCAVLLTTSLRDKRNEHDQT